MLKMNLRNSNNTQKFLCGVLRVLSLHKQKNIKLLTKAVLIIPQTLNQNFR